MDILVACECSGIVRDAFIAKGHNAVSCDILPSETTGPHIQDDVLKHLNGWDAIIAFPPCTDLSQAQTHHLYRKIESGQSKKALDFLLKIYDSCNTVCVENPLSWYINKTWRPYDQIIEPYYFGENYCKRTCLWLKNLPPLLSTCWNYPKFKKVYCHNKHEKKPPLAPRSQRNRSIFHPKVAEAMANQWLTTPKTIDT